MFEARKTTQVATEFKSCGLSILGISEARWIGSGQTRLKSGEVVLYSGHEEENARHTQGVALMLSKSAKAALLGWEAHGPRIISATFNTSNKRIKMNVIQCYAPTNDGSDTDKDAFYSRLQSVVQSCSRRNVIILMGDFNAKIGSNNQGFEAVMGHHGLGEMNENGERFANFCATNQLVVGGSIFPHKRIHKATWISPDMVTQNQIDHLCISKKFRSSLNDVRVRRGPDVASDHHLLVSHMKLKLRSDYLTTSGRRKNYDVTSLKDAATLDKFKLTLTNRFELLQDMTMTEDINDMWSSIEDTISTTCQDVLGHRKRRHKDWISTQSLKLICERREKKAAVNASRTEDAKKRAQVEYMNSIKTTKRSIRQDKINHIDILAAEGEEAGRRGDLRSLYNIIKTISGRGNKPDRPIKSKDGISISDERGQMSRWAEHFNELLNRPEPQDPPDIPPAHIDLPISDEAPSMDEILAAIAQLKRGKAAGPDNIPPEALKADPVATATVLHQLFVKMWSSEQVPNAWKEGHLIKLPKKGDLSNCCNYRGIVLLSVPSKVFNRILLNRMQAAVDSELREQQAGFRKDRACIDQIATLRIILEESLEWNASLCVNFIDFEKAFDSLHRPSLWKLLRHYGVPTKLTNIIANSYDGLTCRVIHQGKLTDSFPIRTGVRQGCILSPFLFLLAMDWIMKTSTSSLNTGINWSNGTQLEDLDFADDIALLSYDSAQMQVKTDSVALNSERIGLSVHTGKSKVLTINNSDHAQVVIDGRLLEDVDKFVYLGSIVDTQGGTDADVMARIGKARYAFYQLRSAWNSSVITIHTKLRLMNALVTPILLYGSETWRSSVATTRRLQVFINTCLRQILKIRWPRIISNQALWTRTNQQPIEIVIAQRRWRWIGHTLRKPEGNCTRQALSWEAKGQRKRGRPRNSWRRDLKKQISGLNRTWSQLEILAQDRVAWRSLVNGLYPRRDQRPE